jgi:hypothetical protein
MFSLCKESDLSIYKVPERISNPRLTRDALEFMLRVNAYPVSERKRASIVRKLINYSIKTDENVTKPFSSHGLLSNEQRLELLSGAEESDQEIARKYLNRASGELFADREVNNMPSNEYPGLTPDSAKELCKTILSNPVKQKKFTEFSKSESSVTELIQFTLDLI